MQLTCPTPTEIRDFLEGSVSEARADQISAHINECPSCDRVVSGFETAQNDVLILLRDGIHENLLQEPELEELRNTVHFGQSDTDTTPAFDEVQRLESGKRLRDYRLVRKIGEGGMGTVYQAFHVHLAKPVALKILPVDKLQSTQSVRRFRQEMRAVGRVNHPNVVSASDAGKIDGQHFLVMELVEGADLARIIQDRGVLSVADACELVRQAAIGLQHAHDSGLVHRDVKPSNLMLSVDGSVKLLDLGLASLNKTDFETSANIVVRDGLTSVGQIMGTLDYMAPEQITASPNVDGRADIYALGATLFQLLTGKTPCGDRSQPTTRRIEAILSDAPLDILTLRSDVPDGLRDLLSRMLAKDPMDRPQTASDVANEIETFAADSSLIALAEACRTSLDMPSADVDVTDDASFLVSRIIQPETRIIHRRPRIATGLFGFFFTLVAASVFFFVTNNGIVKVEGLDDSFQATIDGQVVTVKADGNSEPMSLRVGDHKLVVKVGDTELITNKFEITRKGEVAYLVELLNGKMTVSRDNKQVASKMMPGASLPAESNNKDSSDQLAEASSDAEDKTFADLSDSDLALIYQQITGAKLADGFVSGPDLASSVNILLGYNNVSREKIAENLVKLGKPDVAKIVLSSGRVNPAATEALKLGDLLMESGDGAKAVDAWLAAYHIAPRLFDWKRIETFDKYNRLKELAEVFTEERISRTRTESVTPMHFLLKRLMKDDLRESVGMPFMTRLWKARPDIRAWIVDETKWDEVPDRADYFAQLLIPEDVEKVGNGWGAMFGGGVHGGWLFDLRKILDVPTTRELINRVKPKVEKHKSWVAGPALLAVLESLNGNCEPAKRFLKEKDNKQGMAWQHAEFLGLFLQGKDRELDGQIISLYESCLEERNPKSPYRASRVHELAKLYHKFDRKQDMLDLMYGLVERERKAEEYLVENWGRAETVNLDHERIWDLRTAAETLNSIGYPMDSLTLLSRVTFEQRRAAGVYKGGGWKYNDENVIEVTRKSQKLLNANAIVEAINRGVIPIGLASSIDKKSGKITNPIVQLMAKIARKELSAKASAAFESVNPKLADADTLDRHLAKLLKQHPADVDIAVTTAIFGFLRDDIETAHTRLQVVDILTAKKHKAGAADVRLYLAAQYAKKHQKTADIGDRLANRAAESGKQMNDQWKQFFQSQGTTSAAGDEP